MELKNKYKSDMQMAHIDMRVPDAFSVWLFLSRTVPTLIFFTIRNWNYRHF